MKTETKMDGPGLVEQLQRVGFVQHGPGGWFLALGSGLELWVDDGAGGAPGAVPYVYLERELDGERFDTGKYHCSVVAEALSLLPDKANVDAFPHHAAEVGIDWGVDGCHVVSARNASGAEIFSGVFPGRGRDSLEKAVSLARLLAEASGGASVVGPVGLVEAVQHPEGVAGVLGLNRPAEGALVALGEACQRANEASKHLREGPADFEIVEGSDYSARLDDEEDSCKLDCGCEMWRDGEGFCFKFCATHDSVSPWRVVPVAAIETSGAALVVFHDGKELLSVDLERDSERAKSRVEWANTESRSAGNVVGACIPMELVMHAERKESARKSALVECDHALTWAEMSMDVRNRITRVVNILQGAKES